MLQLIDVYTGMLPEHRSGDISLLYLDLVQAYRQKHRHYHTLSHLEYIYKALITDTEYLRLATQEKNTLLWAMFYHDYVYDPLATDNEQRSADKAMQIMRYHEIDENICLHVADLILATARHDINFDTKNLDMALLLDADLCILGDTWGVYHQYAENIRKEYAIFPDELFRVGRRKILECFLSKNRIYHLDTFREKYEKQARRNLEKELKLLS